MANKDSDGFFPAVYEVVRQIPCGRVMSYGQIARLLGFPRAARQVGWAMRCCSDDIPWQRVVKDSGEIAGGGHAEFRRILLEDEGVTFLPDGRVDMPRLPLAAVSAGNYSIIMKKNLEYHVEEVEKWKREPYFLGAYGSCAWSAG